MEGNKSFSCPSCGLQEHAYIFGDWVNAAELANIRFVISRPDYETFNAEVHEDSVHMITDQRALPRQLAEVETYAEDVRRFQCPECGSKFGVPKRINRDDPNNSAQTQAQGFMPIPNVSPVLGGYFLTTPITQVFYGMAEADLDTLITEMGEDPLNFGSPTDKADWIMGELFS